MISIRAVRCHWVRPCLSVVGLLAMGSCSPVGNETPGPTSPAGAAPPGSSTPVTPAPSGAASAPKPGQTLRLHGSNTIGLSLIPPLATAFFTKAGARGIHVNDDDRKRDRVWVQAFIDQNFTSIEVYAPGSKVAFASLAAGTCDIGMASRAAKPDEAIALRPFGDMNSPAADHVIGIDGIAIIVNKANRVSVLSIDNLARIFAGDVSDWGQVGGAPSPIHVYSRDTNSGTRDEFSSMVMGGKSIRSDARTFDDSERLAAAVSGDVAGIGYVGLPFVNDTNAVAVQDGDGEPLRPTVFTVATEDYPLSRRLHLYVAESPNNPLVRQFVNFVESEEGQRIVERAGFASLELRPESPPLSARAPKEYRSAVHGAERLSVDFRFRTGSAELDTRGLRDLDRVLKYMSQPEHRAKRLLLNGFADSSGSEKANVELSKARAEAVAKELRSLGLSPVATGWGSVLPIAPNDSAEGRERNRRVELWVH